MYLCCAVLPVAWVIQMAGMERREKDRSQGEGRVGVEGVGDENGQRERVLNGAERQHRGGLGESWMTITSYNAERKTPSRHVSLTNSHAYGPNKTPTVGTSFCKCWKERFQRCICICGQPYGFSIVNSTHKHCVRDIFLFTRWDEVVFIRGSPCYKQYYNSILTIFITFASWFFQPNNEN